MSTILLEALKEWKLDNKPPKKIIFDEIKNSINSFFYFNNIKLSNREIQDADTFKLDFEEKFWNEKLEKGGGFKHLLKLENDSKVKSSLNLLIKQLNDNNYLKLNPEIKKLNEVTKEILHIPLFKFEFTDTKFLYKSYIKLSEYFDILDIRNYTLYQKGKVNLYKKEVALQIVKILQEKGKLKYSELLEELKLHFGKIDSQFYSKDMPLLSNNCNKDSGDLEGQEEPNQNIESLIETSDYDYFEKLEEFQKDISNTINNDNNSKTSNDSKNYLDKILNSLTKRQTLILVLYFKKISEIIEDSDDQNGKNIKSSNNFSKDKKKKDIIIEEICKEINKKPSTVYSELKVIINTYNTIVRNENLDQKDKIDLMRLLSNTIEVRIQKEKGKND